MQESGAGTQRELTWSEVAGLLEPWRNYWLGSTTVTGAPHAAPVWGVVVEGTWYLYTERGTVKARNVAADPRVVVHLEDGDDVVLVRGRLEQVDSTAERANVAAAFAGKYARPDDLQYLPGGDNPEEIVLALRPESALCWQLADYDATQRRWRAEG